MITPVGRVTLNLSARSAKALDDAVQLTGESKTDVMNKALQLYADVRRAQDAGGGAWLKDGPDAELVSMRYY